MTIEQMRQRKKELGLTYAMISERTGIPLPTIQKIFHGETKSPRYDTIAALQKLFAQPQVVRETVQYHVPSRRGKGPTMNDYGADTTRYDRQGSYTLEDFYALPDDQRVELIDGVFYDMSAPVPLHQRIAGEIHRQIANYILDHDGRCMPFVAPVDVQLDRDERTMVEPDVLIVCDSEQVTASHVVGAPDFVLEVISPFTKRKDCLLKLRKYENAGVREYWILDPYQEKLIIYWFEQADIPLIRGLEEPVPIGIYGGDLMIDPKHILKWIREMQTLLKKPENP